MLCSPAYDVKCYVLINKDGPSTELKDSGQIKHPCNLLGPIPGINLISTTYRLGTSLIDVISAIYKRFILAYHIGPGSGIAPEDVLAEIALIDTKLKNGTTNFGRSIVELSYIFIMAATLMIKLSRASYHAPITVSHQFLSNFSKKYYWISLIPLTLLVYDWAMSKFYQQTMKISLSLNETLFFQGRTGKISCIALYKDGVLIQEMLTDNNDAITKLQKALEKNDIFTLNSILSPKTEPPERL